MASQVLELQMWASLFSAYCGFLCWYMEMRDKKQWAWTVAAWGLFSRKITLGKAADCLSSKTMKTLGCLSSKRLSIPLFCWAVDQTSCICKQYAGRPSTTSCSSSAQSNFRAASLRFHGEPQAWLQQACWRCAIITIHQYLCQPWVPKYPVL